MAQPATQSLDLPDKPKARFNTVPISTLFDYRKKKLTYKEIGLIHGVTKQTVHQRLQDAGLADYSIQHYVNNRADILAWLQHRLLFSLTDDDLKKMAPDRRIWAMAVLYDKERLERGQSTENLNISSIAMHIQGELAEHQARGKLLFEEMSKRGLSATSLHRPKEVECQSLDDNGHDPLGYETPSD